MGKVHYRFVYNQEIDPPASIEFDTMPADLEADKQDGKFEFEGYVEGAETVLDTATGKRKLLVYVKSSGRVGRSWDLHVTFEGKELEKFPITGTIGGNGYRVINDSYAVKA